jgi:hypothetical protein
MARPMVFRKIAPQVFESTDGFTVQIGSRTTVEYLEGIRKAIVEVEFGAGSICIYKNRVTGWFTSTQMLSMSESEKYDVVERVSSALRFDGSSIVISAY